MKIWLKLRAETSLVKQEMANDVKLKQDRFKQRECSYLERSEKIVYN